MGETQSVEAALDLSGAITQGERREDGYWKNVKGEPLPVSASDLEAHILSSLLAIVESRSQRRG